MEKDKAVYINGEYHSGSDVNDTKGTLAFIKYWDAQDTIHIELP